MINKPYIYLVENLLPDYIINEYPIYVDFIKQYFSILEEDTGPAAVVNNLSQYIDIYRVPEENLINIINQYLASFPLEEFDGLDIRNFITHSKDFYSRKGVLKSLKIIFNLLGGTLDIYYPSDDIFHISSSILSGTHRLHDNVYYAYYVYEIRSDLDIVEYQEMVEKLVHPIGTKVFYVKV